MLPAYTTFLIDLDGVVYRGEQLVPGAREFIHWLNSQQKNYLFLTNNSFSSEAGVLAKLTRLGIETDISHILGAGQASVQNIAHRFPNANVYVIGEQPLIDMVHEATLRVADPDINKIDKIDVVLVGLDRTFTYQKLKYAIDAVRAGAAFIAINRDPLLPVADGMLLPGTGTMVAAIEAGSGITPEVIGKPQPALLQEAMLRLQSTTDETVMIGDVLAVDIRAGLAAGTHTLLVLSGKDTRASLAQSPIKPEYVYEDLGAVLAEVSG